MKEGIAPLLTIFLFFILIVGIIIIYREEIMKMEFFGRLQTTAIPQVKTPGPTGHLTGNGSNRITAPQNTTPHVPTTPDSSFSGNRNIRFGNGRIVNSKIEDVEIVQPGVSLHTITGDVTDYYARGFIEETARLYKTSPYAGSIIFLDRVTDIKGKNPDKEYFVLLVSENIARPITITDWKVFDRANRISHKLPKAIKVLGTDGIQKEIPVIVDSGGTIIVSSGRSPVGSSFLANKCSGYRSQFKNFTPSVKTNCPDPLEEFINDGTIPYTDTKCYAIADNLSHCTTLTEIPTGISKQCHKFLENTITEKGCVSIHRNDTDFFTKEWRLFLNSDTELWGNTDNILYLLDENNKLVATLVYR